MTLKYIAQVSLRLRTVDLRALDQTYAGLVLEGLKSRHQHKVLTAFGKVNAVFANYTLNSFSYYKEISDGDLREVIRNVGEPVPPREK